jgi:hypothetical protein
MQPNDTQSGLMSPANEATNPSGSAAYVDGPRLLEILFPHEKCRPSLRWLRDQQKRRTIPFIKISHLVFFDAEQVRDALASQHTIRPRLPAGSARLRTLPR